MSDSDKKRVEPKYLSGGWQIVRNGIDSGVKDKVTKAWSLRRLVIAVD